MIGLKPTADKDIAAAVSGGGNAENTVVKTVAAKTAAGAKSRIDRAVVVQTNNAIGGRAVVGGKPAADINITAVVGGRGDAANTAAKTGADAQRGIDRAVAVETNNAIGGRAVVVGKLTADIDITAAISGGGNAENPTAENRCRC